jgi:dihydrofolate reductase
VVQVVGGASLIQQLLGAGLVAEQGEDIMPVQLGDRLRLLENLDPERLRLEKLEVREVGLRTSLGFRVSAETRLGRFECVGGGHLH